MSESTPNPEPRHRSSRKVALLLSEINRTIRTIEENGQAGSVSHQKLIQQKMTLLGLNAASKRENPATEPAQAEGASAGDKATYHPWPEWLDPKYPDQLKPLQFRKIQQSAILPLDAVQLRLMELMSVEESNRYVIGRNDHTLQLMRRRDQTIVTLAQMQQALDAQITKLGLDKNLFEAWMTEPDAAEKHAGWRQLPFEERMNRFRRTM